MTETSTMDPGSQIGIDFVPERAADSDTAPVRVSAGSVESARIPGGRHSNAGDLEFDSSQSGLPGSPAKSGSVPCLGSLGGWQTFELMPAAYRARRQAQRTLHRWSSLILVLLSIAIGSTVALWVRGRRINRRNASLVAQAEPIADLRRKIQVMETENLLLEKWCAWVESAKPDDDAVQILGAATLATHHQGPVPAEKHLDVQSIEIKLPREFDVSVSKPPTWAEPKFTLVVTAGNRDILMPWTQRLEKTGRLQDVKLATPGGNWREALIRVNAEPLSTRMVP